MRRAHSTASSIDFTCQIQKPATSSLVSLNGPSRNERPAPLNTMRLPLELGCSPSPASITPAFTSASLKFIISRKSRSLGILPDSESLLALTNTITFIVVLLFVRAMLALLKRRTAWAAIDSALDFLTRRGLWRKCSQNQGDALVQPGPAHERIASVPCQRCAWARANPVASVRFNLAAAPWIASSML